jgi:hypothetical protein
MKDSIVRSYLGVNWNANLIGTRLGIRVPHDLEGAKVSGRFGCPSLIEEASAYIRMHDELKVSADVAVVTGNGRVAGRSRMGNRKTQVLKAVDFLLERSKERSQIEIEIGTLSIQI